jgi:N-acetylglutamate synthase-like GNAT family acetyltransferase
MKTYTRFVVIWNMPIKVIDYGSKQYQEMVNLRMDILRRPLGMQFSEEDLAKEKNDFLLGVYDEDELVACCILTAIAPLTCQLRQMAVHQKMQRNGIGAALMIFAENVARDAGYRKMIMHARKTAIGFYEKLGYQTQGEEFTEVNLPHMELYKSI